MKLISMFKIVSYYVSDLISHLITAVILNGGLFRAQGMDNQSHKCLHHKCVKSGDNNTNVNNDGSSGGSTNAKFTTSEDNRDKDNEDDNNNNNTKGSTLPNPVITNYYCYDQRVYNIYKLNEIPEKSNGLSGLEALPIFRWKYILISLSLMVVFIAIVCISITDSFNWFIFHKLFGYLFNNHMVVVRSDVPV